MTTLSAFTAKPMSCVVRQPCNVVLILISALSLARAREGLARGPPRTALRFAERSAILRVRASPSCLMASLDAVLPIRVIARRDDAADHNEDDQCLCDQTFFANSRRRSKAKRNSQRKESPSFPSCRTFPSKSGPRYTVLARVQVRGMGLRWASGRGRARATNN